MGGPLDILDDKLKGLSPAEVAGWYSRLADLIDQRNTKVKDALAPRFLRHYLTGKGKKLSFAPPDHLKNSTYVVDVLKDHRAWYLTEKPFRGKWVGIISRIQGAGGRAHNGGPPYINPSMLKLTSLVEIETGFFSSVTLQTLKTAAADNDLMTSLHGFQLSTMCMVEVTKVQNVKDFRLFFQVFSARVTDRYDFDPKEYFIVPNPDYKNSFNVAKPVESNSETLTVYHSNAIRMEKAGLAAPFDLESAEWSVTDLAIMGPAWINPDKKL